MGRRRRQAFFDQTARQVHFLAVQIHLRACPGEEVAAFRVPYAHPGRFQDAHSNGCERING